MVGIKVVFNIIPQIFMQKYHYKDHYEGQNLTFLFAGKVRLREYSCKIPIASSPAEEIILCVTRGGTGA